MHAAGGAQQRSRRLSESERGVVWHRTTNSEEAEICQGARSALLLVLVFLVCGL